jgi:DNA polymerase-1
MDLSTVNKVVDTLLLARFAVPDTFVKKSLSELAARYLGWADFADGMKLAFKAAGYSTIQAGYEGMDIDSPVYRMGAMADTVATLNLEPLLREAGLRWTLDHPFGDRGATTRGEAEAVLHMQETTHRVMLRRSAVGIAVDSDYLNVYGEQVNAERHQHTAALAAAGLEGGSGKGAALVDYLDSIGELPSTWPRTPTGKLSATKGALATLDHPLAVAQRQLANTDKILGYLAKVDRQAEVTGRCHPQVSILGASATGRWAASLPEYQQFPAEARGIFRADSDGSDGRQLWSIDWSQIEPITLGNMAGGTDMIVDSYEAGNDLYEPLMSAAGIDRTLAKVCLLASLYGQGPNGLAARIGHTVESAQQIRRQLFAAMPASAKLMTRIQAIAEQYGKIVTMGGRILPVDEGGVFRSVNYTIQGSAADQLAWAVQSIDAAGLGDTILLGLHDELVVECDEFTAARIEGMMRTPHPGLLRWTGGRVPILRCDRVSMGAAWMKC